MSPAYDISTVFDEHGHSGKARRREHRPPIPRIRYARLLKSVKYSVPAKNRILVIIRFSLRSRRSELSVEDAVCGPFSLLVLLCLVGHNVNLLTATVLYDVCGNLCAYDVGAPVWNLRCSGSARTLSKGNLITLGCVKFLYVDDVALCDLVLLSRRFQNCELGPSLSFLQLA